MYRKGGRTNFEKGLIGLVIGNSSTLFKIQIDQREDAPYTSYFLQMHLNEIVNHEDHTAFPSKTLKTRRTISQGSVKQIRMNILALCPKAVISNTNKKKQLTRG